MKIESINRKVSEWVNKHYLQLAVFNAIVLVLVLLRSAGYFSPFFPITINFIVFISMILLIILLNARSRAIFAIALIFWLGAGIIRELKVDVWAERTSIYAYQALVLGVVLLIIENVRKGKYIS